MSSSRKKIFASIFILIVAFVLFASSSHSFLLEIVFKPLIVVSLLVYLFVESGHKGKAVYYAISGLLLSLLGDVLLIFQEQHTLFFIGGLVSFLLAHVSYVLYYLRSSDLTAVKKLKNKILYILLMVIYGIVMYSMLYNNLGELAAPVFVYTSILISMNIFALNRYGKVNENSFNLILVGAIIFAVSDSLLAFNKFFLPIPLAGIWILSTYATAQYFIVQGILANNTSIPSSSFEKKLKIEV